MDKSEFLRLFGNIMYNMPMWYVVGYINLRPGSKIMKTYYSVPMALL